MTEVAARWVRVSSDSQDEANQVPRIDVHIARHSYAVADVGNDGTYEVHDRSASKGEHTEALRSALEDMAAGEYTVLVARHSDRIDREAKVWAWMALAHEAGGRIEFVDEPGLVYAPEDDMAETMAFLSGINNRRYSRNLRKNVMDAHNARKTRGSIVGKVGWGYAIWCTDCEDWSRRVECRQHLKVPAPTDLARGYAKKIHERCISGQSLRSIAAWVRAETGQPITDAGIRKIVMTPLYTGRHTYGDGTVCECEAVVTADMQEQAQRALRGRLRRGQRGAKTLPSLLIPVCLDCGGKAYRTATRGNVYDYAYYCRKCSHFVPCDRLDQIVMNAVTVLVFNEDETEQVWVEGEDFASERARIRRELRELDPDDSDYEEKHAAKFAELRTLPEVIPGHFEEQPTGRTKGDAIFAIRDDRNAMRELLGKWGVAFARDGEWVRVKVNGSPEFRRLLVIREPVAS